MLLSSAANAQRRKDFAYCGMSTKTPLLLSISLLFSLVVKADFTLPLDSGWTFEQGYVFAKAYPATVPGTIHTDLLANGLIPDPFIGTNESKVKWVEEETWIYETEFDCPRSMRKEKHIELQFDGLDTYASVYLNDSLILTAEDMFLRYTIDVKKHIKAHNKLMIKFHPASALIEKNKAASTIKNYPGGDRVFIRKAQYQFGWDWGPRLVTCGIWKPIRLNGWSGMRISDVVYKTDYLDTDTAYVTVDFMFECDMPGPYFFSVAQNDTLVGRDFFSNVERKRPQHLKITFKVPHPRLWWCNGMGAQNLYTFTLTTAYKKKSCSVSTVTGIRKIELSTDHIDNNGAFHFILNDVPVFALGANWIPSDNFLPRVPDYKINNQLGDMHSVGMNMVRVWGGGIYESDYFYRQCDEMGLMVWQDLPFACSMYPYSVLDKNGMLMKEVISNQRRIASHPSIALWCGDNENKEGWYNWGWQKQFGYTAKDSTEIYNDYMNYSIKFMGCVAQHDPFFPYVSTSPQNGWGRAVAYERGDVHYWGVWWGMEPFSSYEDHTGRFVSEFGFQGAPSIHTFTEMGADVSKWFADSTIQMHQKHPTGYQTIETYMKRDYGITPSSFEDYVYLSQVMQKDAMTTAIESQRRNMPTCMGSLFWQYNDCWPGTSWSVQDYNGRKKLAWYALRRLYQPELISFTETADSVFAWVTMNCRDARAYRLRVEWLSFTGTKQFQEETVVPAGKFYSGIFWSCAKSRLQEKQALNAGFLRARLIVPDVSGSGFQEFATANKCFGRVIDLALPSKEITWNFVQNTNTPGHIELYLKSDVYQKDVMVICDDPGTQFTQNCFDIDPGRAEYVHATTKKTEAELKNSIHIITMNKLVNAEKAENLIEPED